MKNTIYKVVIISLLTFIFFGFIDSLFFGIYLNGGISSFFDKIGLTKNNSDIMTSALSTSTAVIMSYYIEKVNKKLFGELIRSPLLDVLGIMIGTYLYIVTIRKYNIITNILSKYTHHNTSNKK
jgi:hypothetical protein